MARGKGDAVKQNPPELIQIAGAGRLFWGGECNIYSRVGLNLSTNNGHVPRAHAETQILNKQRPAH
jgi:hypothetical protein